MTIGCDFIEILHHTLFEEKESMPQVQKYARFQRQESKGIHQKLT